tara:strand:- start:36420 stop:37697 length:1278 start_codon:yes stop_codon:yes gene_type:complete
MVKNDIILYSKDNNGNPLQWKISIVNKNNTCSLYMASGRVGGAKTVNWEHNIVGVNVGKSNANTPYEQAVSRLNSRVTKKKRGGYIQLLPTQELQVLTSKDEEFSIGQLKEWLPEYREDLEGFQKPMFAAQYFRTKSNWIDPYGKWWKDRKHFYIKNPYELKEKGAVAAKFPMLGQPKINGLRSTLYLNDEGKAKLKSKDGLTFHAPSHITKWADANKEIFDGGLVIDGELWIEGESLQVIQSAVKAFNINTPRVLFVPFDLAIDKATNIERWRFLKAQVYPLFTLDAPFMTIKSFKITSDSQAQGFCDRFIKEGHEGLILRDYNASYGFGSRKNTMLKLKRTISVDFTIIRIVPQPKRPDLALFICSHEGQEFKVTPTFDEAKKAHIMKYPKEYIGKKLQTAFYEWTDAGKPLHIVETVVRDYE